MNKPSNIPPHVLDKGKKASNGMMLYGTLIKDMPHDELVAMCALGWSMYHRQLKIAHEAMEFLGP